MPTGPNPADKSPRQGEHRKGIYPPVTAAETKEQSKSYKDDAASELFEVSGGQKILSASRSLNTALLRQAEKLEEFHSTPFTKQSVRTMLTTIQAIERIELQLERWHKMIYPNSGE
jgi:hypothetical protein